MRRNIRDKRGITLIQSFMYVVFALIVVYSVGTVISDVFSRSAMNANKELFIQDKNNFYQNLNALLSEVDANTLTITPSTKGEGDKITFISKDTKVEVIQNKEGGLVLKKTTPQNSTSKKDITAIEYKKITYSDFKEIDKVCIGDKSPNSCHNVSGLIDIVLYHESKTMRQTLKLNSRRTFYYD